MIQVHNLKATSGIVTIAMAALLIISEFFLLDKITQPHTISTREGDRWI